MSSIWDGAYVMVRSKPLFLLAIVLVFVALTGCSGEPVPEDKSEFVGYWSAGDGSYVQIQKNGDCKYKWIEGNTTTELTSGGASFEDGKFLCSFLVFDGPFSIDEAPHEEGGTWRMKLEGKELEKRD